MYYVSGGQEGLEGGLEHDAHGTWTPVQNIVAFNNTSWSHDDSNEAILSARSCCRFKASSEPRD